jgi:16S rRNA processing protein RimM
VIKFLSDQWITVGKLHRVRGNRGELAGEIYSSQPGRAEKLRDVKLEANGRERESLVEQVWYHGDRLIFKFVGIDSISEAEEWAGADILVAERDRALPDEGEYSHGDLIGCEVIGVGVVKGIEDSGGPVLLNVETPDGREVLIPFARAICREIDVAAKTIRVELPEGLLDL